MFYVLTALISIAVGVGVTLGGKLLIPVVATPLLGFAVVVGTRRIKAIEREPRELTRLERWSAMVLLFGLLALAYGFVNIGFRTPWFPIPIADLILLLLAGFALLK